MTYTVDVRLPRPTPGGGRPTPQQVAGALATLLPDGAQITVRIRP